MSASTSEWHPNLKVCPSKALPLLLAKLRDVKTTSPDFIHYARRAMRLVVEDALAEFPTKIQRISTPCQSDVPVLVTVPQPSEICAVSIVRSGDCLLEAVHAVEPGVRVGKILIQRNEELPDKPAVLYYHKFPPTLGTPVTPYVLLCDPMIATAGSSLKALEILTSPPYRVDPSNIIFACIICAPVGLQSLAEAFPDIQIVTAAIDASLNDEKYIVPGLGDYGDRYFNT